MTPHSASKVSEYEIYLRVPELLALQKPEVQRAHHDELLFQVVHQAAELWMKLAEAELRRACVALDADDLTSVLAPLDRVIGIEKLLVEHLGIVETMTPHSYLAVRRVLGQGSGQESPGFNALLRLAPAFDVALRGMLERRGISALDAHREPTRDPLLLQVLERALDFDELFQVWRFHHIQLVKRIIGAGTPSLKGKPLELLDRSMRTSFLPWLWEVRETMFADFTAGESLKQP